MLPSEDKNEVLIVNHDALLARFCQIILSKAGYPVQKVKHAYEALQYLSHQAHTVKAIVYGLSANQADSFLESLEKKEAIRDIPVIGIGEGSQKNHQVAKLLQRPFSPAELVSAVEEAANPVHLPVKNPALPARSSKIALSGELSLAPVVEMIQSIRFHTNPCLFRVKREESKEEIGFFFDQGTLHLATSQHVSEGLKLGHIFAQLGTLEATKIPTLLKQALVQNKPLGEFLKENQILDGQSVQKAFKEQAFLLFLEALSWKRGRFDLEILEALPVHARQSELKLSVDILVLEALKRFDELNQIEPLHAALHMETVSHPNPSTLAANLRFVFNAITAKYALAEIHSRLPCSRYFFYWACQELQKAGHIQPIMPAPSQAGTQPLTASVV